MLSYYIIPFIALINYLNILKYNKKINLLISYILVIFSITIAGFQYQSNIDYNSYLEYYDSLPGLFELSWSDMRSLYGEPIFILLSVLLKECINYPQLLIISLSVLSLLPKLYFFNKLLCNSFGISIYLLINFSLIEFIQIRWGVSIGFTLLFIYGYIKNKKYNYLWGILAFGFHYFSILPILAAVIFIRINFSIKNIIQINLFIGSLLYLLNNHLEKLPSLFNGVYIYEKLYIYLNDPIESINPMLIAKGLIFFIFSLIIYYKENSILNKLTVYFNILSILLISIPIFYMRFYTLCDLLSLAVIFSSKTYKSYPLRIFISLTPLYFVWYILNLESLIRAGYIFPYKTIFN